METAEAPPRAGLRRHLLAALPLAVSLVALAAVVWWATRQEAPEVPRTGEAVASLALALLLYTLATCVRAERWHRIVRRAGVETTRGETYRLTTVGYMGNNVLPARSGDVLRAFLLAPRAGTRKRVVLGTVVAERLLDAVALGLLFAVVAFGLLRDVHVPGGRALLLALAGGAAFAGLGILALVVARRNGALSRVGGVVRPLAAPTRELASRHGGGLLALSVAVWILEASVYLAVGRGLGIELGPLDAVYVMALTNLFALVPAGPGYVGTFDAAVVFALGSLEVSGSDALAYLVLLRFVLFVPITIVGLCFLLTRYGGWSRLRAVRLETTGAP